MAPNTIIKDLRTKAQEAWIEHFNRCSDSGIWTTLDVSISDIQSLETSWKLRWIEKELDNLEKSQAQLSTSN
jgi:hypothetical protein